MSDPDNTHYRSSDGWLYSQGEPSHSAALNTGCAFLSQSRCLDFPQALPIPVHAWAWQLCRQEVTLASGIPGLPPRPMEGEPTQLNKFWHIITQVKLPKQSKGALTLSINTKTKTDLTGL